MDTPSPAPPGVTTDSFLSVDGTRIGYRQMGRGPGLVLLHGALQSSRSFRSLGTLLSDTFTVYIPDRRGRGLSGPFGDDYGMRTEVEDLAGLLRNTGTHNVFGLSSGALVTLQAALDVPEVHRIALYEPPLDVGSKLPPRHWVPRYEKALAARNLPAALAAIIKGTGDRSLFTRLPPFALELLFRFLMRNRPPAEKDVSSLEQLIPTVHFDIRMVAEMDGSLETFRVVRAETLLLGGSRSATYLIAAVDALSGVLEHSRRIEFPGLGHIAADNKGEPATVAAVLRPFFSAPPAASTAALHSRATVL